VKFMMMMHANGSGWKTSGIGTWPPADIQAHIAFMIRFAKELRENGELVAAEGLALPDEAKIIRAAPKTGEPVITDGPFPESKELLAGFWIVDVPDPARAYALAARASAAPGKGGEPMNMAIEVRQVMSAPAVDR
jgi:hypothetical protein